MFQLRALCDAGALSGVDASVLTIFVGVSLTEECSRSAHQFGSSTLRQACILIEFGANEAPKRLSSQSSAQAPDEQFECPQITLHTGLSRGFRL